MGLFQSKKQPQKPSTDDMAQTAVVQIFDEQFRADLRDRGRAYFERIIAENGTLFKQDLDATVAHINTELRQHVARQLDEQFAEISRVNAELRDHISKQLESQFAQFTQTMEDAQEKALATLDRSAKALEEQQRRMVTELEKSVANQDAMLASAVQENKARIDAMKDTQDKAIVVLNASIHDLEEQQEKLHELMEKGITDQKALLVGVFEENMAQVIEHYLLGALGDQYDLKAQLPSIIKEMEANKQTIVDDMKL